MKHEFSCGYSIKFPSRYLRIYDKNDLKSDMILNEINQMKLN